MKLSIIFPCFNEEKAITPVMSELLENRENLLLSEMIDDFEIIVCDDGSTDSSYDLLSSYGRKINLIRHDKNKGYGAALKSCIQASSGEVCVFYDMDGTCKSSDLIPMLSEFKAKSVSMVVGSRMHTESSMPTLRQLGNQFYVIAVYTLFGQKLSDVCSGYRMFDKKTVTQLLPSLPNDLSFTLVLTLLFMVKKIPFTELSTQYDDRLGSSKLNEVSDGLIFLSRIIGLFFKLRVFNFRRV